MLHKTFVGVLLSCIEWVGQVPKQRFVLNAPVDRTTYRKLAGTGSLAFVSGRSHCQLQKSCRSLLFSSLPVEV